MRTVGEQLLRGVLEAPEDDAPRLVYADWLEENGDGERAEFIRVCAHAARAGCFFVQMGDAPHPCRKHYNQPGLRDRPKRYCDRCWDIVRVSNQYVHNYDESDPNRVAAWCLPA